jgi:ATP-dependent Lhr-like helicase
LTGASAAGPLAPALAWFEARGWQPFDFQLETAQAFLSGAHGLLNAPTGSGKTFALWMPVMLDFMQRYPDTWRSQDRNGLQCIWITPLRALSKDIVQACQRACEDMGLPWRVEARTGDTSGSQREKQRRLMPEGLITTPESLHVLLASADHPAWFRPLRAVVVDEWHELMGTKRGVQVELALARLRQLCPGLRIWGISATIGNLDQAAGALLGSAIRSQRQVMVRADLHKEIRVESVLPDRIERFPWAGHLGLRMAEKTLPLIESGRTTLIFTNTRAQAELWYQGLLEVQPDLAGLMAMHHGSIDAEQRAWVEEALHAGTLKAVVCTSSLDLGVDFRPVDTVIQVGGPKGVARFIQRAGRSGHAPGEVSRLYFVPTHSLELIEAAALRQAVAEGLIEERMPIRAPMDVLVQYLLTRAVGTGFRPAEIWEELRSTYTYEDLTEAEFAWALSFIRSGGDALQAYAEYQKIEVDETGLWRVADRRMALQHRLSIGTIVSDTSLTVKYQSGQRLGTVEESFISQLSPGDTFWFGGRCLELIRVRNLEVQVRKAEGNKGIVPRWMGSRMPLSSQMSKLLRRQLDDYLAGRLDAPELALLVPLLDLQARRSAIPAADECLIESIRSREGFHLFCYPFEGRTVHEILAALLAWRISKLKPISFSIAMNDYGFELLSDQEIPFQEAREAGLFSADRLDADLTLAINQTEMALRRFREIAAISGLVFKGMPGKQIAGKHLQASTALLFKVFREHDPDSLLLKQAYTEVLELQVDRSRLRSALERLDRQQIRFTEPVQFTPFCFPILVDRLRERLSSEKLADRVAKLVAQMERHS